MGGGFPYDEMKKRVIPSNIVMGRLPMTTGPSSCLPLEKGGVA
jgi:hypothetical protein